MIWSLSLPQIAATLAAALVAFQTKNGAGVRLIDEPGINTVLVMVVVTSIQGPIACAEDIDYTPRPVRFYHCLCRPARDIRPWGLTIKR
jgi:hypothetical protein